MFSSILRSLSPMLHFLFATNPAGVSYGSTSMLFLFALCGGLIIASFALRAWRKNLSNPVTKKLSRSWSSAAFWFGLIGLVMTVCRIEQIQFLAMRFFWLLWVIAAVATLYFQYRQFKARHYKVLPRQSGADPRDRYLPKKRSR